MEITYKITVDKDSGETGLTMITPNGGINKEEVELSKDDTDRSWQLKRFCSHVHEEIDSLFR